MLDLYRTKSYTNALPNHVIRYTLVVLGFTQLIQIQIQPRTSFIVGKTMGKSVLSIRVCGKGPDNSSVAGLHIFIGWLSNVQVSSCSPSVADTTQPSQVPATSLTGET